MGNAHFLQEVFEASIGHSPWRGLSGWFMNRLWPRAHRRYLNQPNASVTWSWGSDSLMLPYAHALPRMIAAHPGYSQNLPRLVVLAQAKYHGLRMIDVGANVGDTVHFVRHCTSVPILCIEGSEEFLPFLRANTSQYADVDIAEVYLGERDARQAATVESIAGTAHLVVGTDATASANLGIMSLDTVLSARPRFAEAKLLKSDTDGFEAKILRGSVGYLERARPVIFLEYDPFFLAQQGDDSLEMIDALADHGYASVMVYDNYGDLMVGLTLGTGDILEQITEYFSGRCGLAYADLAVFHRDDTDLFERCMAAEREHYRGSRRFDATSEDLR